MRLWLLRGLVAIAAALMMASFIMTWWYCDFRHAEVGHHLATIEIYAHGLRHTPLVGLDEYLAKDETPFYQTVLAWVYLTFSIGLMLYSTRLKGRKGRWLLGGIGLVYIAYAAIAVIWIAIRTEDFGLSLQGWSSLLVEMGFEAGVEGEGLVYMYSTLRFGYYLAYVAGGMCIALVLFRNLIVGKPKLSVYY